MSKVRNLEIIGEAVKQISLIHGYFVIDYDIVWNIAINELPDLKRKLEKILEESA